MGRPKKETTVKPEEIKPAGLFEIDGDDEAIVAETPAVESADETHPLAVAALVEQIDPGEVDEPAAVELGPKWDDPNADPVKDYESAIAAGESVDFVRPISCDGPYCSFAFDERAEARRIVRESFGNSFHCVGCGGEFSAVFPSGRCPACERSAPEERAPRPAAETYSIRAEFSTPFEPPREVIPMEKFNMVRNNPIGDACTKVDHENLEKERKQSAALTAGRRLGEANPDALPITEIMPDGEIVHHTPAAEVVVEKRQDHEI